MCSGLSYFDCKFFVLSCGVAASVGAAVWQRPKVNARDKMVDMIFVFMVLSSSYFVLFWAFLPLKVH